MTTHGPKLTAALQAVHESTRGIAALRGGLITVAASLMMAAPAAAQVGSADEARNLEGISILEGFVYTLQAVVPFIALIIVLASLAVLMTTRDPQKKSEWKKVRNQAVLYGFIVVPALGILIGALAGITGNPVLEGLNI